MVDREARSEALRALQRFLDCVTTNDEYESEYPLPELFGRKASKDPAIRAIHSMSWNWFDDFKDHKLEREYELDPETKSVAERCHQFLRSDYEYEWKETNFISTGFIGSVLTTLGIARTVPSVEERIANHLDQPEGEASAWPFFRNIDRMTAEQTSERMDRTQR
jgi:hypothetical protein